jgi:hypothetical protein
MIAIHLKEISGGLTVRFNYYRQRTPGRGRQKLPAGLKWLF